MTKRSTLTILICTAVSLSLSAQQNKANRPSPPEQAQCKFSDGKTITVDYSSPRMKGRKIFGDLVPYGEVWRAGANEATTFVTTTDVASSGTNIPAGSYTIFTVPEPDKWTLIINKHTGEWGTPYKYQSEELARVPMSVSKTSAPVENFTISFDQSSGACKMSVSWEHAQASADFAEKK